MKTTRIKKHQRRKTIVRTFSLYTLSVWSYFVKFFIFVKRNIFPKKADFIVIMEDNPFLSLELVGVVKNLAIVHYADSALYTLIKKSRNSISYKIVRGTLEAAPPVLIIRMLLDRVFLRMLKSRFGCFSVLTFYDDVQISTKLEDEKIPHLLAPVEVRTRFSSKVHFSIMCEQLALPVNSFEVFFAAHSNAEKQYEKMVNHLGLPFVAQNEWGSGGTATMLVNSYHDFLFFLQENRGSNVRATKYLKHTLPISVQVCILHDVVIIQPPCIQLVGIQGLVSQSFQFCGNDTTQSYLRSDLQQDIQKSSNALSNHLKSKGYIGLLGIDFLYDLVDQRMYIQECNTRPTSLTRLITGIQKKQGKKPDLLTHIELLSPVVPQYNSYPESDRVVNLEEEVWSQFVVRNTTNSTILVEQSIVAGIYLLKGQSLTFVRDSLSLVDIDSPQELLITQSPIKGTPVPPGATLCHVVMRRGVLNARGDALNPDMISIIQFLQSYVSRKETSR